MYKREEGTIAENSYRAFLLCFFVPFCGIEEFADEFGRLTVTHDELDQEMFDSVSLGWPAVISGLKTLLETGTIGAAAGKRPANCG
jgi:hypothetical protein